MNSFTNHSKKDTALTLNKNKQESLSKAAKIANLTIEEFLRYLSESDVVSVDYSLEELDKEMHVDI